MWTAMTKCFEVLHKNNRKQQEAYVLNNHAR